MGNDNNIGLMRLVLASLVVVAHAIEIRSGVHQPFGRWCVDAFFILSGFLVTASALRSTPGAYALKRFLRIFPGYAVAYVLSVSVVGPMIAEGFDWQLWRIALFAPPPAVDPVDVLTSLNSSMWSIAYEFRCYILIGAMVYSGALADRRWLLGFAVIAQLADIVVILQPWALYLYKLPKFAEFLIGQPRDAIHMFAGFSAGAAAYLYRNEIMSFVSWRTAAVALGLIALSFRMETIFPTVMVLAGTVILLWLAYKAKLGALRRINRSWDISYGTYLYGWPAGIALITFLPGLDMLTLILLNLAAGWLLGALSWFGVERPFRYRAPPALGAERSGVPAAD